MEDALPLRSNLLEVEHEVHAAREVEASNQGLELESTCQPAEISRPWSLKRSLPSTICLIMIGTVKAVCGCVGKWCVMLFRKSSQRPQASPPLPLVLPPQISHHPGEAGDALEDRPKASQIQVQVDLEKIPHSEPHDAEVQAGIKVAGFYLNDWQLPPGLGDRDLDALVSEVHEECSAIGLISHQQALRLTLGMGYSKESAVAKWREVVAWRNAGELNLLRSRLDDLMCSDATVSFANDREVYNKLFRGCPCALLTADDRPVSVWHAQAPKGSGQVTSLDLEDLNAWSREVFEYADLWVTKDTERTGRLTGYIQVYNMQGLSLRQVSSKEVTERLKGALSAGGFYVEAVAHIYVINASRLFSMAWKLVRGFLSPWTASKITVSSEVPDELLAELGGSGSPSALHLERLLVAAADVNGPSILAPVLRPTRSLSPRRSSEESVYTGASTATCSTRASTRAHGVGSCEPTAEEMLYEEMPEMPEGSRWVAGFLLRPEQLPPGIEDRDLDALVDEVHAKCGAILPTSKQQALRLVLGMGYSSEAAVAKWQEIVEWRAFVGMDLIRQEQADAVLADGPVRFPGTAEVHDKLICTSPCAFLSIDGSPISIWHAGTMNTRDAGALSIEQISQWSRAVFEYKDAWICQQSEKTKRLVGYVQVYDMRGMNWRHYSSRELVDKLKAALQTGGFYVEAVSHMFVINASTLFSATWKVVRNLISPWTASKISVSSGVPDELIHLLGGPTSDAALKFQDLQRRTPLEAAQCTSVLRPTWQAAPSSSPQGRSSIVSEFSQESVFSPCGSRETPQGMRRIAGFLLAEEQLPKEQLSRDWDSSVAEVKELCSQLSPCTTQQALRLLLGMGDRKGAVEKWKEIVAWRVANRIEDVRREQSDHLERGSTDNHFPNSLDVCNKLIRVEPCVLRAADGSPVSIWYGGSLETEATNLTLAQITAWSHAVFEYKDLWISQQSEGKKTLMGYIQVYDMQGVSLRLLSQAFSKDVMEKMKRALDAGSYYMEAVSHMYVINASTLFSMAWKVVRQFIPPRTASKISVSKDIPEELVRALGGSQSEALKSLKEMLSTGRGHTLGPVLRPHDCPGLSG
ncbi:unnamed protein product [Durusdinium trenchii]|uniref:Phosphatidylinositol/phosphatidylcholine transfer protein SFH7 (Protein SEC FOURTEEN HOMOLOGS 7) (AtSFH7) n=2 Tax=Durusdinium trenchii TaxID=1381693 RepID=A0ABP0R5T9_9DINO